MIMFCKDLKEQAMKIINYEKKKIIPLTEKEKETQENQKVCYICNKEFRTDKKYCKVRDHFHDTGQYRGAALSICNFRYQIPKDIPVVFHNGSTYDYHFIIRELAKEFKGYFECIGENTEKYITFSVPIKKELDDGETIANRIRFKDSFRFMQDSLSNLVDNLSQINNNISYESLIKKFFNTYQLCNNDLNKFALLLRKGVYPYEYMDSWNKFNEPVPMVEDLYFSELNQESITKKDLKHVKKVCDTFKIKNMGEYHDL